MEKESNEALSKQKKIENNENSRKWLWVWIICGSKRP